MAITSLVLRVDQRESQLSPGPTRKEPLEAMLDTTSEALSGDPTCGQPKYCCLLHDTLAFSTDIRDIIRARDKAGLVTDIDHTAISHLLHDGFVPQPRTVYRDIFVISMGFSASIVNGAVQFSADFPFAKAKSRQDQVPNVDTLLPLLARATDRACEKGANALLMLSSGLDSTSLALAAKEAGRGDILCVTYGEPGNQEEAEFARRLCHRLALRHETYVLDVRSTTLPATLLDYARKAPEPCADPALTACIAPIARFSGDSTVVLDGSGSDFYFWKPPPVLDLIKLYLGFSRIPVVGRIRGIVPMYLRYERLLSTPLEPMLFAGPRLRHHDTRQFYPDSVDTHHFWLEEFARSTYPADEVRHTIRSIFMGPAAYMLKGRNAALANRAVAQFPWADPVVADYCFNLPEANRFDRRTLKSKIIVREMLRKFADYDDDLIGKRVFSFGKRVFIEQHLPFLREEIMKCTLWSRRIESCFDKLKIQFLRGHKTENALLNLLMVSLWHNHWVTPRMAPIRQQLFGGLAA